MFQQFFDLDDDLEIVLAARDLVILPDQIERAVKALEDPIIPAGELLDGLGTWKWALAHISDMSQRTDHMFAGIDEGTRKVLRTCSRVLNSSGAFPATPQESLTKLQEAGEELRSLLHNPAEEIDPDLRALLIEHIDAILNAVTTFRVSGRERLLAEIDRYAGHLFRCPAATASVERSSSSNFYQALIKFGAAVAVVVAATGAPTAIAANIESTLELLSGPTQAEPQPPAMGE